ncbi:tyrosine-type recombinase/integrase [Corynebacterium macclintockiae]|uniref:tyrosine-type recombinase/integrase n=1 Tax=Corynebacterium macclintockiae TaxID=2913501 RepID=UPI003EBC5095
MASIKKYATAKGTRWRVQYRSPDGRSRTKRGFETKAKAQAWADKNAVSIHEQDWIDPTAGKITVGELGAVWRQNLGHLKPKTRHDMLAVWRNHVDPMWGGRGVASIKPSEVQTWVSNLDRSASLVRQAHAVLAQILDVAVQDRAIRENPARGVKLPRKQSLEKVYLTAEQLEQLAGACTRNGDIVWVLGTVGLRWGELAALRVRDVNVLRSRLSIERNAVTVGTEVVVGTPKSHERREVIVPASVMRLIEARMVGKGPDGLLWPRRDGTPMRPPSHGDWYYTALERCMWREVLVDPERPDSEKKRVRTDFPRVTPHGLRHVAAGLMVSAGANVLVVSRQLGHADPSLTLRVYAALWDEDLDRLGTKVEALLPPLANTS